MLCKKYRIGKAVGLFPLWAGEGNGEVIFILPPGEREEDEGIV